MSYMTKNYMTDGGNKMVIGGILQFEDGAEVSGFPGAENQEESSASSVSDLKDDFNALLIKLKEAGVMHADAWNITVRLAPALTDPVAAANNEKASVAISDNIITITADVDDLEESESSEPSQGTHKWIGLGIGTGLQAVTLAKYNGFPLTQADADEAASVGLDNPGEFVLYVRAEELTKTPKKISLDADGYAAAEVVIRAIAPAA